MNSVKVACVLLLVSLVLINEAYAQYGYGGYGGPGGYGGGHHGGGGGHHGGGGGHYGGGGHHHGDHGGKDCDHKEPEKPKTTTTTKKPEISKPKKESLWDKLSGKKG